MNDKSNGVGESECRRVNQKSSLNCGRVNGSNGTIASLPCGESLAETLIYWFGPKPV